MPESGMSQAKVLRWNIAGVEHRLRSRTCCVDYGIHCAECGGRMHVQGSEFDGLLLECEDCHGTKMRYAVRRR